MFACLILLISNSTHVGDNDRVNVKVSLCGPLKHAREATGQHQSRVALPPKEEPRRPDGRQRCSERCGE